MLTPRAPLGITVLALAGLALGTGALGADPAPAATVFTDGFERSDLTSKLRRVGPVRIQSRISAGGSRALLIPRTRRRAAFVTRRFPLSRRVVLGLSVRRSRRGMQRLAYFPRSRVSVFHDGRRLRVLAGGRLRTVPGRVLAGRSFKRVGIVLDARRNRLSIYSGGRRRAVLKLAARSERMVRIGGTRNRHAPTWIDNVRLVASASGPGAGAGGTSPSPRTPGTPGGAPTGGAGPSTPGSPTSPGGGPSAPPAGDVVPVAAGSRFFADDSVWNTVVSGPLEIDPNSSTLVDSLVRQARAPGLPPTLNSDSYSTAVYTVDGTTPEVDVELVRDFRPQTVINQFKGVPLPAGAQPAGGTDSHLVVHRPSTNQLWEFWTLRGSGGDWQAGWGGRLDNVSGSDGVMSHPAGATASGLPLVGGLITLNELRAGQINHALALAIPEPRAEWFTAPANRTDGYVYSDAAVPEGARLRIDPSVDLDSLGLPRPTRILAEAAQRHGLILRDVSGVVALYGEDPGPSGSQAVYDEFYGGLSPQAVVAAFPWDRLQVLKMDLRCCWNIDAAGG